MDFWQELCNVMFVDNQELLQIIATTLLMSCTSTVVSCAIGIPLGILIAISEFRGKKMLLRFLHTLMGLPPVLAGLIVFFLLCGIGPFGQYHLLYSVPAMVIAQILLITPIAAGLSESFAAGKLPLMAETMQGLHLGKRTRFACLLGECKSQLFSVFFTGFGRAISEVGAAQLVGGNIQYKTRVLTTAIVLETNKGNFEMALALGIILLVISFVVMGMAQWLQEVTARD